MQFVHFKTKAAFDLKNDGVKYEDAIVFILDALLIYTHGKFYNDSVVSEVTTLKGIVDKLDGADTLDGSVKKQIKEATDALEKKIMTGEAEGSVATAYDTLKEIADWISSDGEAAAALGTTVAALNKAVNGEGEGDDHKAGLAEKVAALEDAVGTTGEDSLGSRVDALEESLAEGGEIAEAIAAAQTAADDALDAADIAQADATAALEAIGDSESGLVKDIADLLNAISGKDGLDIRISYLETFLEKAEGEDTVSGSIAEAKKAGDDAAAAAQAAQDDVDALEGVVGTATVGETAGTGLIKRVEDLEKTVTSLTWVEED